MSPCRLQRTPRRDRRPTLDRSIGDSYDNALAESVIGLYKTELIRRQGPWRNVEHVRRVLALRPRLDPKRAMNHRINRDMTRRCLGEHRTGGADRHVPQAVHERASSRVLNFDLSTVYPSASWHVHACASAANERHRNIGELSRQVSARRTHQRRLSPKGFPAACMTIHRSQLFSTLLGERRYAIRNATELDHQISAKYVRPRQQALCRPGGRGSQPGSSEPRRLGGCVVRILLGVEFGAVELPAAAPTKLRADTAPR